MASIRSTLPAVIAMAALSIACRSDEPSRGHTTRTPARVDIDAGAEATASAVDPDSAKPATTGPSDGFHLDETSRARSPKRSRPSGTGRTLHLTLRSTPPGATAAVDGRVIGTTPTYWEGPANGRPREFTFVHAGYAMARYRFVATNDGVVHGTLTKVVVEESDAGPPRGPRTPAK